MAFRGVRESCGKASNCEWCTSVPRNSSIQRARTSIPEITHQKQFNELSCISVGHRVTKIIELITTKETHFFPFTIKNKVIQLAL